MKPPSTIVEWPPKYRDAFKWRQAQKKRFADDPEYLAKAKAFYKRRPIDFILHWADSYDPRNVGTDKPAYFPLLLFDRQVDFLQFLHACFMGEADGLCEKSRDVGATWLGVWFSIWLWLFWPGTAIGWGSYKRELVDQLGDSKSIFEKIRLGIKRLPSFFLPEGFLPRRDMTHMRVLNPANGATIIGEIGDNIGRGGRTRIYFKDESAHYEHPDLIDASLSENTRCQIDMSSVNGIGNPFYRKRFSGEEWTPGKEAKRFTTNVFIFDWEDHPGKDKEWFTQQKAYYVRRGQYHLFAQEVERNYSAAVIGTVIPAEWVRSSIDAHVKLGWPEGGQWCGALDVFDEGGDMHAFAARQGSVLRKCDHWGEGDTGEATRRAIGMCDGIPRLDLQYDAVGVGAGVKAESNRLKAEGLLRKTIKFIPWFAGAGPLNPDKNIIPLDKQSPLNKDFYHNLKAQGWWELRLRFERTHRAVTEGVKYDPDELISLPSDLPLIRSIEAELSQATASKGAKMKLVIDKAPEGTASPNLADAIVMAYWPANQGAYNDDMDWVN